MAITGVGHGIIKFTSNGSVTGRHLVTYVRWVGATAAGATAKINDAAGNEWFSSLADGQYFIDIHPIFRMMDGVTVAAMSSGTMYVYTA